MFKNVLLMSLFRRCFCLFVAGVLLMGPLSVCPRSLTSFSVAKLDTIVFDTSQSACFIGAVDVDDSSDFLAVMVPEVASSVSTELPLQSLSSLLLLPAAGFSSLPFARPPPVAFLC